MKIITAIQILIKLFTIGYGMGASPWRGGSPHPRRGARGQTPAVSTLLTPVSLCFLVWRRPETGDRFEKENGRGFFLPQERTVCAHFSTSTQCRIPYCYTGGFICAGATQGELPEGQERVPWGMTVSRNSLAWWLCPAPTNCILDTTYLYITAIYCNHLHHIYCVLPIAVLCCVYTD